MVSAFIKISFLLIRKYFIVTGILLLSGTVVGQDVNFYHGTWDQAVKKAKDENKYIVVDAFAEWCGPCKRMDMEKFHGNKEVADFVNEHFIAFKADCEKSPAAALGLKFKVISYPTLLFFNPEGQLVLRNLGYSSNQKLFLEPFQKAIEVKSKKVFAYDSKNLNPGFPAIYTDMFKVDNKPVTRHTAEEAIKYLDGVKDKFSEQSWAVIFVYSFPGRYQQFFIDNYKKYYSLYNAEAEDGLRRIASVYVNNAMKNKDEKQLDTAVALVMKYIPDKATTLLPGWQISFYHSTEQWKKFANAATAEIQRNAGTDMQFINQAGWILYQKCDDPEVINQALGWMDSRISEIRGYEVFTTYASLLFKGNRLDDAEKYALKAIDAGESDDRNVKNVKDLLGKIRDAKSITPGK